MSDFQQDRPSDWACPNPSCINNTKMVFGTKSNCPKCGTARDAAWEPGMDGNKPSQGMQGGDMPGDWQCPNTNCINNQKLVFAKHQSCPSCGTARNAKQTGDWLCPNNNCVNHRNCVFASKTQCPKCGAPKPMGGRGGGFQMQGRQGYGGGCGGGCWGGCGGGGGGGDYYGNGCGGGGGGCGGWQGGFNNGGGGGGGGMTDWACPNSSCINNRKMVFGKNSSCPKCGTPKPSGGNYGMGGGMGGCGMGGMGGGMGGCGMGCMGGGMGGMGGMGMRNRGGSNPGDWRCPNPECMNSRNQVFAKHSHCPRCGTEKPEDGFGGSAGRSRSPRRGGYGMSMTPM